VITWKDISDLTPVHICRCSQLLTAIGMVGLLSACSKTISFKEEVELAPGNVIVIAHQRDYEKACEGFSCGWRMTESRILKSEGIPVQWSGRVVPMVISRNAEGGLVLIAFEGYCQGPPYQQFALRNGRWEVEQLSSEFHGKVANLLVEDTGSERLPQLLTLKDKDKLNRRPGFPDFMRRVLPAMPRNC
jgi:hypothetical protein